MREVRLSDYTIAADYVFDRIPEGRITVNTINAYSWVMADKDPLFRKALIGSDYLLPDGIAVVWAARFLRGEKINKIAGAEGKVFLFRCLRAYVVVDPDPFGS